VHLQYAKPQLCAGRALDNNAQHISAKSSLMKIRGLLFLVDTPQAIALMKKAIDQIERPLDTMVVDLKYAKADVVAKSYRSRIDAKAVGSITADERSNQLLLRVFPGRRDEVEKIIRSLDEPTRKC